MDGIAFFGKGGIGKSTVASNVSVILGAGGGRVLHVGCDPKMDSTLSLMGRHIEPFAAQAGRPEALLKCVHPSLARGVSCVEAGGPQPGVGCAGTGIGAMLDAIKETALLETGGYTAAVFDVLGDVVCGGFAAPLRRGFARKAVIVVSEEMLSLYAANKLMQMIENYSRNGVFLAGLAVNAKDPAGVRAAEDFARAAGTKVLGVIPRDPAVGKAERRHRPAVLAYPASDFARSLVRLAAAIRAAAPGKTRPAALSDADFFAFAEGRGSSQAPAAAAAAPAAGTAAARLEAAGLLPAGLEGGQLLCSWNHKGAGLQVLIVPGRLAQPGMHRHSDWAACFHPSVRKPPPGSWEAFGRALKNIAGLGYDALLAALCGEPGLYDGLRKLAGRGSLGAGKGAAPRRPHMGFGQWDRFIFPRGSRDICTPPDAVLVEHGDSECRFSGCDGGTMSLFGRPAGQGSSRGAGRGPLLPKAVKNILQTDFCSADAAGGDEGKMAASLAAAASSAGRGGLVEFYVGCSPLLLASDVAAFAGKAAAEGGVKVLTQGYNSFNEYSPEKAAARSAHLARRFAARAGKPAWDVNLAGHGACRAGLSDLLASAGLTAVPAGEGFYAASASSRLQVLAQPDEVLEAALKAAGRPFIVPPAPYGFAGTTAWLKAVTAALRPGSNPPPPPAGPAAEYAALRRKAAAFEAGFVAAAADIASFLSPAAFAGVPVPAFLSEAGFALRLLLPASEAGKAASALAGLRRALPGCRISSACFAGRGELRALLRVSKKMRLVYSDVSRDARVLAAGRTPFAAGIFEAGYEGAAETLRRLLELCEGGIDESLAA
jgi:nitrogenase iron protein NifH